MRKSLGRLRTRDHSCAPRSCGAWRGQGTIEAASS